MAGLPACTPIFATDFAKTDPHHASRGSTRVPPSENEYLDFMLGRHRREWAGGGTPDRSERLQFLGERVASAGVPGER